MNCAAARERLCEHVLGVLAAREADALERHLAWCAACRTEARGLAEAAALLPHALAPAVPPEDLLERVVARVASARGDTRGPALRRSRLASVAVVAALLAVAASGFAAVMAGRASRAEQAAANAATTPELGGLSEVIRVTTLGAEADVYLGVLMPTTEAEVGGSAATVVVPRLPDRVLVVVQGLSRDGSGLPWEVQLVAGPNDRIAVGRIAADDVDAAGAAEFGAVLDDDLRRYDRIRVRDRTGAIVLRGSLELQATTP